ncbi:hypothetical protein LXL04_019659 [Taraxacum kok-saghyz]
MTLNSKEKEINPEIERSKKFEKTAIRETLGVPEIGSQFEIGLSEIGLRRTVVRSDTKWTLQTGLGTRRPWKEMFNLGSINFPQGISEAFSRVKMNIGYFRMNYAIVVLVILFLSLLWHPISLIVLTVLMAAWLFLYFLRGEPLTIFHRVIDDRVVLGVLSVVTIVLLLLTDATMNIVLSILGGIVLVLIHAVLRKTEDLYLDEEGLEAVNRDERGFGGNAPDNGSRGGNSCAVQGAEPPAGVELVVLFH